MYTISLFTLDSDTLISNILEFHHAYFYTNHGTPVFKYQIFVKIIEMRKNVFIYELCQNSVDYAVFEFNSVHTDSIYFAEILQSL